MLSCQFVQLKECVLHWIATLFESNVKKKRSCCLCRYDVLAPEVIECKRVSPHHYTIVLLRWRSCLQFLRDLKVLVNMERVWTGSKVAVNGIYLLWTKFSEMIVWSLLSWWFFNDKSEVRRVFWFPSNDFFEFEEIMKDTVLDPKTSSSICNFYTPINPTKKKYQKKFFFASAAALFLEFAN